MSEKKKDEKPPNPIQMVIDWVMLRLERTIFLGLKFTLPKRFVSPLGFLGMLTFIVFIILGVTGALLLLYYVPTAEGAFESVVRINDDVAFGLAMRNIHYHASNAMVLLALAHMYYQYFSGRYKLRYEVLWVTGIILGTLTIVEAYTGYDLILNERGLLAINIGRALMRGTPVIGPVLYQIMAGSGLGDLIIRFYAFHVFIIPLAMVAVMMVHLPRALVLDIPVVSIVTGIILLMGGFFPIELGVRFRPEATVGITLPEWYLTGLYAIVRTGIPGFLAGVVIPNLFLIVFLVVPFLDTGRKLSVKDRPFYTALGVGGLAQLALATVWGFRGANPLFPPSSIELLMIDPYVFFGGVTIVAAVSYGVVYSWIGLTRPPGDHQAARPAPRKWPVYRLSKNEFRTLLVGLLAFQLIFDLFALQNYIRGFANVVLLQIGAVLIAFGILFHLYRIGSE